MNPYLTTRSPCNLGAVIEATGKVEAIGKQGHGKARPQESEARESESMASLSRGLEKYLASTIVEQEFSATESLYGGNPRTETDQSSRLELYSIYRIIGQVYFNFLLKYCVGS